MTCVILIKEDSFAEPEAIQSKADTKVKADDMINWDKFCSHSAVCARTVPRTECVWVCVYMNACVCIYNIFWVYMLYMITSDEGGPDHARWDPTKITHSWANRLSWRSRTMFILTQSAHAEIIRKQYGVPHGCSIRPRGLRRPSLGIKSVTQPGAGSEQTHTCRRILNKVTFYVIAVNIAV